MVKQTIIYLLASITVGFLNIISIKFQNQPELSFQDR